MRRIDFLVGCSTNRGKGIPMGDILAQWVDGCCPFSNYRPPINRTLRERVKNSPQSTILKQLCNCPYRPTNPDNANTVSLIVPVPRRKNYGDDVNDLLRHCVLKQQLTNFIALFLF